MDVNKDASVLQGASGRGLAFFPGVRRDFESLSHMKGYTLALDTWGWAQAQHRKIWWTLQRPVEGLTLPGDWRVDGVGEEGWG